MSKRGDEWVEFGAIVLKHVDEYSLSQYGDMGEDRFTTMTCKEVMHDARKHFDRFGKGQRGTEEQLRDFKKIAHEVCVAYFKYKDDPSGGV
jgi:hypothetical protein